MDKKCHTCQSKFVRPRGYSNKQWESRRYCKLTCIKIDRRTKATCIGCSAIFSQPRHLSKKFCTRKCKEENQVLFARKGPNAPNWQGGITASNNAFRHSKAYRDWRKSVFERDKYTCQICSVVGGQLNADHINSFASHPELRLDLDNGRTLCVPCHRTTPTYAKNAKYH